MRRRKAGQGEVLAIDLRQWFFQKVLNPLATDSKREVSWRGRVMLLKREG